MNNGFKNPMKITSLYSELIERTVEYRNTERNCEKDYVLFGMLIGTMYQVGGIEVIGRATNGWDRYDLSTKDLFYGENRLFNRPEKLTELKQTNNSSKFWLVLNALFAQIYGEDWEQYISYTNYCKIAPDEEAENNGTPPKKLRELQDPICRKIIAAELDSTQPGHILVFTGCKLEDMDFSERTISALSSYYLNQDEWPECINRTIWGNGKNWLEVYKMGDTYVYLTEHPDTRDVKEHATVLLNALKKYLEPVR